MSLTAVSLFAGVEGFGLALERAGIDVVAAVEIDPAARGVIADRFPNTRLYEDVTRVHAAGRCAPARNDDWESRNGRSGRQGIRRPGGPDVHVGDGRASRSGDLPLERCEGCLPDVDPTRTVLTGGFPCQDLSVAGRRAGLDGARSGLFWEIDRLLAELAPAWVVLENVPGLLSSHGGADMGAVLGSLGERGYGFAYRVLDAQHFGVPQRRRRVFIVGRLGDRAAPVQVLLEPEGSGGHPTPRREEGQDVAGTLGGGSGNRGWAADTERMTFVPATAYALTARASMDRPESGAATLIASSFETGDPFVAAGADGDVPEDGVFSDDDGGVVAEREPFTHAPDHASEQGQGVAGAGTGIPLARDEGDAGRASDALGVPTPLAVPGGAPFGGGWDDSVRVVGVHDPTVCVTGDKTDALTSEGADASEDGTGRGTPLVPVAFHMTQDPINGSVVPAMGSKSGGNGVMTGGPDANASEAHARAVLHRLRDALGAEDLRQWCARVAAALRPPAVLRPGMHESGLPLEAEDLIRELVDYAQAGQAPHEGWALRGLWNLDTFDRRAPHRRELAEQLANELEAVVPKLPFVGTPQSAAAVRRLTPLETERLQGFPDGWTATSNGRPQADSARYRQMGNAVAVPVVEWIARRIAAIDAAEQEVAA